ncbi:relaxase domain-containing protein [Streptomyces pristinaespiralis]|uniref:relaxase domain-containing protein n=1 Tax=Streptomyces pristinaespiralis TaxID=38300 RepID=UPI0001852DED|nr:relaxase domain-containing protein [Streptomyces pristinaespiralis]QMU12213.1 relaxase domain-containing protein [Streptomyces pristinaespiralis]
MIAARFRHFEDRDGGPLLHDHVLLSVKVRRLDGRWGTLHTRPFLEYAVALSELYNQRLMEEICEQFDLATGARYPPRACGRSWNSPASPSSSSTSPPPATQRRAFPDAGPDSAGRACQLPPLSAR